MVRTTGVVRIYPSASGPVHALRDVDTAFAAGRLNVVAGPSGSGKSSLLRIVGAVDRPTAGGVQIAGQWIEDWSPRRLRRFRRATIAYVLQRPSHNLFEQLTVRQHLLHASRVAGHDVPEVDDVVERLQLGRLLDRRPAQLSGGEQQRVALAAAAAARARALITDEPTAELDADSAQRVLTALARLAEAGICVIASSHDPAVAAAAHTTVVLRHGAVHSETRDGRALAVIDGSGRIQLPAEALHRFPQRRVHLQVRDDHVRLEVP